MVIFYCGIKPNGQHFSLPLLYPETSETIQPIESCLRLVNWQTISGKHDTFIIDDAMHLILKGTVWNLPDMAL